MLRRHQHIATTSKRCAFIKFLMTEMSSLVMLTLTILLVLSISSMIASTWAESEINDLNALETKQNSFKNSSAAVKQNQPETRQYPFNGFMMPPAPLIPPLPPTIMAGCPLCDSSVYSYCSHKLIHDSCCCDFPGSMIYQKPTQCFYTDCSLLYAKSCYEHSLIKNCCCNNPY